MRIGIITFHFPYNCGAILQCAALQNVIERMGHQAVVINYKPWYHQNRYTYLKNPIQFAKSRYMELSEDTPKLLRLSKSGIGFVRAVGSWRHYAQRKPQDDKFREFREAFLNETRIYRSLKQLQNAPPECDLYISGSDQLWNCHLTEKRFDRAYFLDFGADKTVRVSYAVGADFTECKYENISLDQLLSRFDRISLREDKCKSIIEKNANGIPVCRSVDPTLLLNSEAYGRMTCSEKLEEDSFILTYTMPNESQLAVYAAAERLSEKTGKKIIDVSGNPSKSNRRINDNRICGPDEFLWYIQNADYVMTNSFHGTVFSVIYKKIFMVIPHTDTGNRVTELLDSLGLSERYTDVSEQAVYTIDKPINYAASAMKLEALRAQSMNYLEECVRCAEKRN